MKKLLYKLIVFVCCFFMSSQIMAGGRGGHSITFDPNSNGGVWTCFRTQASGTCGAATAAYFDAACDGIANDSAAITAWLSYGVGLGSARANLYIPPGSKCLFNDGTTKITFGVQNPTIWAYGASLQIAGVAANVTIGGFGIIEDNSHSALIETANAGDGTVQLKTAADASIFSIGSRILIDGLSIQSFGQPPNFQYFEYKIITNITGTTTKIITLESLLKNTYLSTWPAPADAEHGGPATIHLLDPTWNTNVHILGLTVKANSIYGGNAIGRNIILQDMIFEGQGPNYTVTQNAWGIGLSVAYSMELDKNIEFLSLYNFIAPQLTVQSASLNILNLTNVTLTRNSSNSLSGTGYNTTIVNSIIPGFQIGPTCCGKGQTLLTDGVTVPITSQAYNLINISDLTFSAGTFSIAYASGAFAGAVQWGVPGARYYFVYDGAPQTRIADGGSIFSFTISTVRGDGGTNYFFDLSDCSWGSCSGALPTPTFGGQAANKLVISPAVTITQKNSPAGSADLTQFAAPP